MPLLGSFTSQLFTVIAKIVTTGDVSLKFTLNNPNPYGTSAGDNFSNSVAVSGDYAIIGALNEDDTGGVYSGKAYIYNVTTGVLLHTLNNPNAYSTSIDDFFGARVAISGNYAVVGAYGEDDVGGLDGRESGKAYIYNVTTGALLYTLNNPNAYGTVAQDRFGFGVAVSGNYAIISANGEAISSGKAYIYNVTTGALLHTLNNPNVYGGGDLDNFGGSVAISGNYAIVGANGEDQFGNQATGKAYIFNVTTGALVHTLNNPNAYGTPTSDQFGLPVAISGNYAVVGGYQEDSVAGGSVGNAYIFNVTTGALLRTLNNPNAYGTGNTDNFGYSVAISGNYLIVGATEEDDAGGLSSGKAYIFNVTTGALLRTLNNPSAFATGDGDRFGSDVAISGDYAIVGATNEDDAGGLSSGKAYIYQLTAKTGGVSLKFTLDNPNAYGTSAGDNFSGSVAVSGDYAIIGASGEDDDELYGGQGKAYIYNVTTGALLHTLNNPNGSVFNSSGDRFGYSVAISGNYAIVGVPLTNGPGANAGKAYIYNVTTGALLLTLNNPDPLSTSADDEFGYSVAISGNYAIVGIPFDYNTDGADAGLACIYNVTTGALVHTLNNPNAYGTARGDLFGISVAISDNCAIVGAYGEDSAAGSDAGKAYIFNVTTGALLHTLINPNTYVFPGGGQFGVSVAISGNYAIVGARDEDDAGGLSSGKVHIYNVTTGALVHTLNNPNAYGTSADDRFGWRVAISGIYAVVGAQYEDGADGTASGNAYIFNVTTGVLLHILNNPNPYGTRQSDEFGNSVTISGNYVIVGANGEDDAGGTASGKAYIYELNQLNIKKDKDRWQY